MQDAKIEARIRRKFRLVAVELDERRRRQWAAVEARDAGWGWDFAGGSGHRFVSPDHYGRTAGASEAISDQDLLHALCQPDQPVVIAPPLGEMAESEQISQMRSALRPNVSECCTDADLLAAAQNPHGPLFANGLCQVQTLFRHRRVELEDALCFTSRRLERERVEAQFWHSQWCDSPTSGKPTPPVEMIAA